MTADASDLVLDPTELLLSFRHLTMELEKEQRTLGHLLVGEKQAKVNGFAQSNGRSNQERENDGAVQALHITEDIFKVRANIEALKAAIEYTRVAIQVALNLPAAA